MAVPSTCQRIPVGQSPYVGKFIIGILIGIVIVIVVLVQCTRAIF